MGKLTTYKINETGNLGFMLYSGDGRAQCFKGKKCPHLQALSPTVDDKSVMFLCNIGLC